MKRIFERLLIFLTVICYSVSLTSCTTESTAEIPVGSGAYAVMNDNVPQFSENEITTDAYEKYSMLDILGRCGTAVACIGTEIMPTEERGSIGQIKPSGWQMAKYDIVDGKYLYNRCHLIGYQLSGENANELNLITGTRYMNVEGMLPFENMVAEYIKETNNHVMYRVTPVYDGNNLLASGVNMEALSVEDDGRGVSFNVFVYNIQPGIEIDYRDGTSKLIAEEVPDTESQQDIQDENLQNYILNTNTKKFHDLNCLSVDDIKPKNKEEYNGTRKWLTENGYSPCGRCNP